MMRRLLLVTVLLAACSSAEEGAPDTPDASATRYVVYYNSDASPASALVGLPYTHVILSFLTARADLDGTIHTTVPDKLHPALDEAGRLQADGKKVLISFGGGEMKAADYLTLTGHETALARAISVFVQTHGLDGVDIDFEISSSLHQDPADRPFDGRKFLISLTQALHGTLGAEALITHVPEAPYLNPAWHGGPYWDVLHAAGGMIDWVTVQYYNNPGFNTPLANSGASQPAWSYPGIADGQNGRAWPAEKTLVGKPIYRDDAASGYVPPERLFSEIVRPLAERYGARFGGLAGWQFSTLTADHQFWNREMARGLGLKATSMP